jgi:hypothetical protein
MVLAVQGFLPAIEAVMGSSGEHAAPSTYQVFDSFMSAPVATGTHAAMVNIQATKGPFYVEQVQVFMNPLIANDVDLYSVNITEASGTLSYPSEQSSPGFATIIAGSGGHYGELVEPTVAASAQNPGVTRDPCGNPAIMVPGNAVGGNVQFFLYAGGAGFTFTNVQYLAVTCGRSGASVTMTVNNPF